MPNNIVKSFADKTDKSVNEVEKKWDKAKKIVKDQYDDVKEDSGNFYKLVTGVLKKMLGLNENWSFKDHYEIQKLINEKKEQNKKE